MGNTFSFVIFFFIHFLNLLSCEGGDSCARLVFLFFDDGAAWWGVAVLVILLGDVVVVIRDVVVVVTCEVYHTPRYRGGGMSSGS